METIGGECLEKVFEVIPNFCSCQFIVTTYNKDSIN